MGIEGRRRLVQSFPHLLKELWDKWEIQALLLISLVSQIILTLLGNRRKYGTNKVKDLILWSFYTLADQVPSIALGAISGKLGNNSKGQQMEDAQGIAFWAPFFLMHCGGPDTITAYSSEDNNLWLRNLTGFVVQTVLALYITYTSWDSTSWLSYLSVPMLVIGCFKFGEKTWCLYSARNNYSWDWRIASYVSKSEELTNEESIGNATKHAQFKVVMASHFSDMIISTEDVMNLKQQCLYWSFDTAFQEVDTSNGAFYDTFYTKALVALTVWGCISRVVALIVLVLVLTLYIIFVTGGSKYSRADHILTYILLVAAIILDILSPTLLAISSQWTEVFLETIEHSGPFIKRLKAWFEEKNLEKRKGKLIAQCNLLTTLCSEEARFDISEGSLPIKKLEEISTVTRSPVSSKLMEMIFNNIAKKARECTPIHGEYRELVKAQALRRRRLIIENMEFHQTILLWHIVTDVCYYCDHNRDNPENGVHSQESKRLSDYTFYLLVMQRHMLPIGTGLSSLRDTAAEAIKYFQERKTLNLTSNVSEACNTLLQHIRKDTQYAANHPSGRSVFRYAFVTADDLLSRGDMKQMWEFLIELWIEILNNCAANCRADRHIQQLRYGGELITDIWTLQFYGGLLDHFQLTQPFIEDENI